MYSSKNRVLNAGWPAAYLNEDMGILPVLLKSPFSVFVAFAAIVLVSEIVLMSISTFLPFSSNTVKTIIHSCLLILFLSPAIYFFLFCSFYMPFYDRPYQGSAVKKNLREQESRLRQLQEINEQLLGQIDECKRTEKSLLESEEKFRSLVDSTEDSIYLVDKNYRYVFMNKKHLSRLGLSVDEFKGRPYGEFHSAEETAEFIEKTRKVFETGRSIQHEHRSGRDNGYFLRTLSPVRGANGKIKAVTVISKQITELKRIEEELLALSLTDELTGLYNRRGFLTIAKQQLITAARLNKRALLISADLDNLKGINDTMGHQKGDKMLIETADVLKETFRESDIIARIGGDEFMILLIENTDDSQEAFTLRLQENIETRNMLHPSGYNLSISIGIACSDPENPHPIERLMDCADKLMYEDKRRKQKAVLS